MYRNPKSVDFTNPVGMEYRFQERHFTVAEIGELWNLSGDVVRNPDYAWLKMPNVWTV